MITLLLIVAIFVVIGFLVAIFTGLMAVSPLLLVLLLFALLDALVFKFISYLIKKRK